MEMQTLFAMNGGRAMGDQQIYVGGCCDPVGGVKKKRNRVKRAIAGDDHDGPTQSV